MDDKKPSPLRIAFLEDDAELAEDISHWLREAGYVVERFDEGHACARAIERGRFDAALLDWVVPDLTGPEVLTRVRTQLGAAAPAMVFLTCRDSEADVVEALEAGADDFLVKPISRPVLLARLQAVLRRAGATAPGTRLRLGDIEVDTARRTVFRDGLRVELTERETDLALHFLQNINRLLTREHLIQTIWGLRPDVETRTIDVHVSALRRKLLGADNGWRLVSVYGRGYRLERQRDPAEPGQGGNAPDSGAR